MNRFTVNIGIFPFSFSLHIQINKLLVATLFISTILCAAETKTQIDSTSQSIVSRLNPALRKALLKALSNIEIEASSERDDSAEFGGFPTSTVTSTRDEELLEESTAADLQALNLYNSYITDGVNFTQQSKDDNEIIHTIIVKAPRTTVAPSDRSDEKVNDQVIIQFGAPDPVKDSDVHIETVQIARSVKTNEIDDNGTYLGFFLVVLRSMVNILYIGSSAFCFTSTYSIPIPSLFSYILFSLIFPFIYPDARFIDDYHQFFIDSFVLL